MLQTCYCTLKEWLVMEVIRYGFSSNMKLRITCNLSNLTTLKFCTLLLKVTWCIISSPFQNRRNNLHPIRVSYVQFSVSGPIKKVKLSIHWRCNFGWISIEWECVTWLPSWNCEELWLKCFHTIENPKTPMFTNCDKNYQAQPLIIDSNISLSFYTRNTRTSQ